MKYRKKPVVIEAVQYDGNFRCLDIFSIDDVGKFIVGKEEDGSPYLIIPTLEGEHKCSKWDYVIKGVKGEYYPCKPDVFELTYERDEPTVIQAPINNYDVWDEVIDQVGSTNEMIDHIGDSNEMVDQAPDVGKMVSNGEIGKKRWDDWDEFNKKACYPEEHQSAFADGFTRGAKWVNEIAKETLFTEEQVREVLEKAQLLNHNDEFAFTVDYLIQSLKQGGDK